MKEQFLRHIVSQIFTDKNIGRDHLNIDEKISPKNLTVQSKSECGFKACFSEKIRIKNRVKIGTNFGVNSEFEKTAKIRTGSGM